MYASGTGEYDNFIFIVVYLISEIGDTYTM